MVDRLKELKDKATNSGIGGYAFDVTPRDGDLSKLRPKIKERSLNYKELLRVIEELVDAR